MHLKLHSVPRLNLNSILWKVRVITRTILIECISADARKKTIRRYKVTASFPGNKFPE